MGAGSDSEQSICALEGYGVSPVPLNVAKGFHDNCSGETHGLVEGTMGDAECRTAYLQLVSVLGCVSAKCLANADAYARRAASCAEGTTRMTCEALSLPCDRDDSATRATMSVGGSEPAASTPSPTMDPSVPPGTRVAPPPPPRDHDSKDSVVGSVISGVAGAFVLLALLGAGIGFVAWRRRRERGMHTSMPKDTSRDGQDRSVGVFSQYAPGDAQHVSSPFGSQHRREAQQWQQQIYEQQYQTDVPSHSSQCATIQGSAPLAVTSQRSTIYDVPPTMDIDLSTYIATMLATQRPLPSLADMLSADSQRDQLTAALQATQDARPPEMFMGRYLIMKERRSGGQATVQFARGGDGGFFQYAIKCVTLASLKLLPVMMCRPHFCSSFCRQPAAQVPTGCRCCH